MTTLGRIDPMALHDKVKTLIETQGIPVRRRNDAPDPSGRWAIIDGPAIHDDPDELNMCGDTQVDVVEVTILAVGDHTEPAGDHPDPDRAKRLAAYAGRRIDQAMKAGPVLPGTTTPVLQPSRGLTAEDPAGTRWSWPLIYQITA